MLTTRLERAGRGENAVLMAEGTGKNAPQMTVGLE